MSPYPLTRRITALARSQYKLALAALLFIGLVASIITFAQAEPDPPLPPQLPSSFYGAVQFVVGDFTPIPDTTDIDAYADDETTPSASATIMDLNGEPVYAIKVPAYEDGTLPTDITFKIDGRVVATADWVSGTNAPLIIHPPLANAGGPYTGEANVPIQLTGSAQDVGFDVASFAWSTGDDGEFSNPNISNPTVTFTSTGTHTISLKVTDSQGGEGFAQTDVVVIQISGLTGQIYDGTGKSVTVSGEISPYTYTVLYNGTDTLPVNAGEHTVDVQIKDSSASLVGTITKTMIIIPKPASVTPNNAFKHYGENDPDFKGTLQGFIAADNIIATYYRDTGEDIGEYTIYATLSPEGKLPNYDITYNTGTFTILGNQFSIDLDPGWNLVSFNLQPEVTDIATVLASIEGQYTMVYAWDASGTGEWIYFDAGTGQGELSTLDERQGFWILMTENGTLEVTGALPVSTTITLYDGWNLVGFPSLSNVSINDALADLISSSIVEELRVYAYNPPTASWRLFDQDAPGYANDLSELTPGMGYWIKITLDGVETMDWVVPYVPTP